MNKVFFIFIFCTLKMIICDEAWNLFSRNTLDVQDEEENLFSDINDQLQAIINNVFTCLNLNRHYIGLHETRLLLAMHASLKKISENNYYLYKDVINASKLDLIFNEFKNTSLFKLDKPIDEIMALDFSVKINNTQNVHKVEFDSIEIPDDSEEIFVFLRDYLNNNEKLELQDLAKPSKIIKEMFLKHKKFKEARRKNFKPWKARNESTELNARRVFKGNQVKIKKFPFVASIHVKNKFICTGALISRNLVISAASCFHEFHYNPKFLQDHPHAIFVRLGSEYPDRYGDSIEARNVFIHPNYEMATLRDNIAIIQIKKHIHLKKKNRKIKRVEFQKMKGGLPNSVHEIILIGWGDKEDLGGHLSYSHLKLHKLKDCVNIYPKYVTEKNFCAGFSGKGAGACQRDAGGPAIVSDVLVGVVSFGPPVCGSSHAPTVFTDIGHHVSWIESIFERIQGRSITTTANPSNYLNLEAVTELTLRQYSPPQETPPQNLYTISNPRLQLPESLNLLSNVLRDIMFYNENRFGMRPNVGPWNTTTVTSTTMARDASPPNQINRIMPLNFNDYAHTRPSDNSQNTSPTIPGSPFNKMTMKPFNFYTKYGNFSLAAKSENSLRYATESFNQELVKEEESSSDSENYESSEEEGMGIEMPSTNLPPTTPHREGRMALYSYASQSKATSLFPKSTVKFEIPPLRQFQRNPVDLIKHFVKNRLAPVGSQIGLPKNDFGEEAENFLIKNYLKERLYPLYQQGSFTRTVPSFKDNKEEEKEYGEPILGKRYQNSINAKKAEGSDEFVLLLLKHSTVRKRGYRYLVAGNTRDGYVHSYMRGLSSSSRTSKSIIKGIKNIGSASKNTIEDKFIIQENSKPTIAYEPDPIKYNKNTNENEEFQETLLTTTEKERIFEERRKTTNEREFMPSRFSLVPGKHMKQYARHSRFVTRLFRDVAKKRAVPNGVISLKIQSPNVGQTNKHDNEKQLIWPKEKYRSYLSNDSSSISAQVISNINTTMLNLNTDAITDRKDILYTLTPGEESILEDYENEKISSSSETKYNNSTSSESKYNDSSSSENMHNGFVQVPPIAKGNDYPINQIFDSDSVFLLNPYSTIKDHEYENLTEVVEDKYQYRNYLIHPITSKNSTTKAAYITVEEFTKPELEKYNLYSPKTDRTIKNYEYEKESKSREKESQNIGNIPSAVPITMNDMKEKKIEENNFYISNTTVKNYEYDSNFPTLFRAISSNSNYFSSPEDLLYYRDDNDQDTNNDASF